MKPHRKTCNPMLKRSPEPFKEPRTIPTGWDLSEFLPNASAQMKAVQSFETQPQTKSEEPKLSA